MSTTTIAVVNNKGGVGKTTSTLNLGAALANAGKKVLLVDMDSQGNLSRSFGLSRSIDKHIGGVMVKDYPAGDAVVSVGKMDLLPATLELLKHEKTVAGGELYQFVLSEAIEPLKRKYDYILIDCPPSLSALTVNALVAADYFLIPLQPEFYSYDGLRTLVDFADRLKKLNPRLQLAGIFATKYNPNARKRLNHDVIDYTREKFGEKMLAVYIRDNISLAESPLNKTDVFTYAPDSNGAKDYKALSNYILKL